MEELETWEIGELFFRAAKEERQRHQQLHKGSHKASLEENLGLLDEQAWAEMCVHFGWKSITEYQSRL